jgi:hypothetical protein
MRRFMFAAVLGLAGVTGIAGTADAHWHDDCHRVPVRAFYRPTVVYSAPVVVGPPAVFAPPVVYPTNSVSFFGRNFALRFGF